MSQHLRTKTSFDRFARHHNVKPRTTQNSKIFIYFISSIIDNNKIRFSHNIIRQIMISNL